jgi:hypothetical protein
VLLGAPAFCQRETFVVILQVLSFAAIMSCALAPRVAFAALRAFIVMYGLGLGPL